MTIYANEQEEGEKSKLKHLSFVDSIMSLVGVNFRRFCGKAAKIKPFEEIPGPKGPFGLGSLFNYFKIIGEFSLRLNLQNFSCYVFARQIQLR